MVSFSVLIFLLVMFQIKHYLCDYAFQTNYMLNKFNKVGWVKPLLAHSLVHAIGTFIVIMIFNYNLVLLALVLALLDMIVHFTVDKLKIEATREWKPTDSKFWHHLGMDQMAHHLTHYIIITILILTMMI